MPIFVTNLSHLAVARLRQPDKPARLNGRVIPLNPYPGRQMRYCENASKKKKPGELATLLIAASDAGLKVFRGPENSIPGTLRQRFNDRP